MKNALHLVQSIVVHPGFVHVDELLAIALVMGHLERAIPVSRREPTPEELTDPSVACIDVGRSYEIELNNFDHHQFVRGDTRCAFTLIADAIDAEDTLKMTHEWYISRAILDTLGPIAYAKRLGMDPASVQATMSPFEECLKSEFEKIGSTPELQTELFMFVGKWVLSTAKQRMPQVAAAQAAVTTETYGDHKVLLWLDMPMNYGVGRLTTILDGNITVTKDDRGPGLSLFRVNDRQGVDFSKLNNHPDVTFAHNGGFVAKTSRMLTWPEIEKLLEIACLPNKA